MLNYPYTPVHVTCLIQKLPIAHSGGYGDYRKITKSSNDEHSLDRRPLSNPTCPAIGSCSEVAFMFSLVPRLFLPVLGVGSTGRYKPARSKPPGEQCYRGKPNSPALPMKWKNTIIGVREMHARCVALSSWF
ncbi:hypothetical protein J6590_071222 [Homalodisca vitripennis]|nr:hypothetical protein J6590_071222 [Homalodisca vitripennis]